MFFLNLSLYKLIYLCYVKYVQYAAYVYYNMKICIVQYFT